MRPSRNTALRAEKPTGVCCVCYSARVGKRDKLGMALAARLGRGRPSETYWMCTSFVRAIGSQIVSNCRSLLCEMSNVQSVDLVS